MRAETEEAASLEADIENLQQQLKEHRRTFERGDESDGVGYVAARGVKRKAEEITRLREQAPTELKASLEQPPVGVLSKQEIGQWLWRTENRNADLSTMPKNLTARADKLVKEWLEQGLEIYLTSDGKIAFDKSIEKPKSIRKLGGWFPSKEQTEISVEAIEALKNGDEEEQVQAIFNFAVGFYHYDSRYLGRFDKYLKSPSVKVRLATIRAIGFQLWDGCIPLLEHLISSDPNPAVRAYATETLRQIQQPDFDPDNLYENSSHYPDSFESITEKGLMKLPQIKEDLQAWMRKQGYSVMDALVLYQYLKEKR